MKRVTSILSLVTAGILAAVLFAGCDSDQKARSSDETQPYGLKGQDTGAQHRQELPRPPR